MADRVVRVTLVGNNASLKKAIADSQGALQRLDATAAKSQASLGRMESGFGKAMNAAAFVAGAGAITGALNNIMDSAARVQTTQNALVAVFERSTSMMTANAEAAHRMGLAQSVYSDYAVRIGSQLKNMGISQKNVADRTDTLISLGADLAAQFGGPTQQAVLALSATFRGEYDPIERYGITLKKAGVEAHMAMTGMSQAQATMALMMEQSADALGAVERNYDTYAAAQQRFSASFENAKASLGEGMMPVATELTDKLGMLAQGFASIPPGVRQFATSLALGVTGIIAMRNAMGALAERTAALSQTWAASGGAFRSTLGADAMTKTTSAVTKMGNAIPVLGAVLIGAAEAYSFFSDKAKEGAVAQEAFQQSLLMTGGLDPKLVTQLTQDMTALGQETEEWKKILAGLVGGGTIAVFSQLDEDAIRTQESVDRLNKSLEFMLNMDPSRGAAQVLDVKDQLIAAGVDEATVNEHLAGSLAKAEEALQNVGHESVNAASKIGEMTENAKALSDAARGVQETLDAMFTGLDLDVAAQKFSEAIRGMGEAMKDGWQATDAQEIQQAWNDVTGAMIENGDSVQSIMAAYDTMRARFKANLQAMGMDGKQLRAEMDRVFGKRVDLRMALNSKDINNEAQNIKEIINRTVKNLPDFAVNLDTSQAQESLGSMDQQAQESASIISRMNPAFMINTDPAVNAVTGLWNWVSGLPDVIINIVPQIAQGAINAVSSFISSIGSVFSDTPLPPDLTDNIDVWVDQPDPFADMADTPFNNWGTSLAAWSSFSAASTGKAAPIRISVPVIYDAFLEEWNMDDRAIRAAIEGAQNKVKSIEDEINRINDQREKVRDRTKDKMSDWKQRLKELSKTRIAGMGRAIDKIMDPESLKSIHTASDELRKALEFSKKAEVKADRISKKMAKYGREQFKKDRNLGRSLKYEEKQLAKANELVKVYEKQNEALADGQKRYEKWLSNLERLMDDIHSLASSFNQVDIGKAWADSVGSQEQVKSDMDAAVKGMAESYWNPRLYEYWAQKMGEAQRKVSGTAVEDQLAAQLKATRDWTAQLLRLKGKLGEGAYQQLIGVGPEQGNAIARALLSKPALLAQFNNAFANADFISKNAAARMYNVTYSTTKAALEAAYKDYQLTAKTTGTGEKAQTNINVTVKGVTDPAGVAREINRLLREEARRNGQGGPRR